MATHKVKMKMKIPEIPKCDVSFMAYSDKKLIGELLVSKGAVVWRPAGKEVNIAHFTWAKFAEVMEQHLKRK